MAFSLLKHSNRGNSCGSMASYCILLDFLNFLTFLLHYPKFIVTLKHDCRKVLFQRNLHFSIIYKIMILTNFIVFLLKRIYCLIIILFGKRFTFFGYKFIQYYTVKGNAPYILQCVIPPLTDALDN